ncbi:N-acetylmuramoyl-L-alanine amidase [Luteolibacter yonseiensis]|uniref:N-acetylmuramoyl-L-alanine amidase n=1 Tax=Luteolibacter yonseiensis TaxID=1144680 RepID=A0A934VCG9_9BACT|nr:N-acetylmuramoyl-L-alanine amidase [Luteolibacter yonseiensis]MBK1816474.1 N-acetylmuramoyl-L-alanine amidase [Luteolibacter yonseiensis]
MEHPSRSGFRLRSLFASLLLAVTMLGPVPAAPAPAASKWNITKIDGRSYVSVDDIKSFYNFTKMSRSGATVILENAKVEMQLKVGGTDCLMNNVKFVFSQTIAAQGDKIYVSQIDLAKLIDPVLRPNFIQNAGDFRTVVLDPGHGGKDPGATNALGTEARYNIKVAEIAKKQLEARGFRVVMTRTTDVYQSLQERVDFANAVKEDAIYVSIHFNSGGRSARGIETFTLSPPGISHYGSGWKASDNQARAGNEHDSANIALATSVHGSILRRLGKNTLDRGIKRARFSVLSGVRHPAILLEGGFMSHPYEAKLIDNGAYQNAIATGIVEAIAKYRFAVGNVKAVPRN